MASGNAAFTVNKPFFDLLLARFYAQNPDAFSGSEPKPLVNMEFVFRPLAAPVMDLSPRPDGNIAISFTKLVLETYDYTDGKRGQLTDSEPVQVTVAGTLALEGNHLALTKLSASGTNTLDQHAADVFQNRILPQYRDAVDHLPLPDFSKLMGVQVTVTGVDVSGGVVRAFAFIEGGGQLPAMPAVDTGAPVIIAAIGQDAINNYLAHHFGSANVSDSDSSTSSGFGYRWSASAWARNPRISITGGRASGALDAGASASGGFKAPVLGWTDKGIGVSVHTPPIGVRVEAKSATSAVVEFYLDGTISVDFGSLPGVLKKVADGIMSGVRSIVNPLVSAINGKLSQATIPLFKLPSTVPGTSIDARLTFGELGLRDNAVVGMIDVA